MEDNPASDSTPTPILGNKKFNYPGTSVYFVPPPGYTLSSGPDVILTYKSGSHINDIQVSEKKGVPFKPFTLDQYASINPIIKIQKFERTKVSGYDGLYIEQSGFLPASSVELLFGDSTFLVSIMVRVNKQDVITTAAIKSLFETVSYDKNKKISPYEAALFTIDDSKSNYKLTRTIGESFIFTPDKNFNDYYTMKDNFCAVMPVTPTELPNFEKFIEQSRPNLQGKGAVNIRTSPIKTMVHDKITISEVEIAFESEGGQKITYLALIDNGKTRILLDGICHDNFERNLKDFRILCKSLTFNDIAR